MGCLCTQVVFRAVPPTGEEFTAALCQHTGETITLSLDVLSCSEISPGDSYFAFQDAEINGWELLSLNLKGGYLWFAAIIVLQRLGGTSTWQIPSWAFKPWYQAKREQKRWFARRFTFDAARRLGIVK